MLEYLLLLIDLCRTLLRSRSDLVAENLLLRQQLASVRGQLRRDLGRRAAGVETEGEVEFADQVGGR